MLCIIVDIFIGGIETSATVLKWFILYLMNHPVVQVKMQLEINKIVEDGRSITLSDKPNLPYCKAVMYETLQLTNLLPLSVPHVVSGDIENNGYVIPNGCLLIPSLDSAAFDDETFPDSNLFKPERFLDECGNFNVGNGKNLLTFSLGK